MSTAVVLFTRDLRVHDNPALSEAARACDRVIPLFVLDDTLLRTHGTPIRRAFLAECLADLRTSLRSRGADLVVRRGETVEEAMVLAHAHDARILFVSADASAYAQRRQQRLEHERIELRVQQALPVIEPGALVPDGRDHYRVFTPYWRRWRTEPRRAVLEPPERIALPERIDPGPVPEAATPVGGGETEGRRRLARWLAGGLEGYGLGRLLAAETSRLSPYLHFGCVSAAEVATRATGAEEFLRQLCWRDFFMQLLAARPRLETEDLRTRTARWRDDDVAFRRWRDGETGVAIVDAGMRQLHREGWLPNRARLIVAGHLTKTLGLDWRLGARVFSDLLLDADVANNSGNWQWVAGTGVDTRPRGFNASAQARRFDPAGTYVRRYVNA